MLTGEKPEVNAEVARAAGASTGTRTSSRTWPGRASGRSSAGMLPHTNLGVLLARGAGAAARGDGLAGPDARVGQPGPGGAPGLADQAPGARGWRRSARPASCASRSPAGSWWGSARRPEERVAALEALAEVHAEHGHLQEVILQNFVPHPRYYGAEPAEIADEAQRGEHARRAGCRCRRGRTPISLDDMRVLVRECRAADARRGRADPAEPVGLVAAAGGGGRHRPRRAVGQRRPHLARAPVPVGAPDAQAARSRAATRSPSGSASTRSTWTRSGSSRACST